MTWDAYNRRKAVLNDVLAVADRHRDTTVDEAFEIVQDANHVFTDTTDLLLDTQMLWFQRLNGQMERQLTEGSNTAPEMTAIDAWMTAAAAMPGARTLLDANADRPELAKALTHERTFLAISAGVPDEHPELEARGQLVLDKARDSVVYPPESEELETDGLETEGFLARLRQALVA